MSQRQLSRRQFLRATSGVAITVGFAGCGGDGGDDEFDATVRAVSDVPQSADETGGGEATPDVTPVSSDALEITENIFQRAGTKGLVVAGNVENTSDQTFEEILVEVTLYDSREFEDDILDSTSNQSRHDTLESGEVWQWAVKFTDDPDFEVGYYAVTIRGRYA